ncbi:MAG TPA: hypothetical protein VFA11_00965 [Acidimicrobiales bacterium]|nr:hypothetical protein [Acidimicrobiales bacterium]
MRLQRWAAWSALAFVAVTIGGVVTESAGPDITTGPAQVAAKIATDRPDVLVNSILHTAQGMTVVVLSAALAALLASARRHLAAYCILGFGLATAAASLLSAGLSATVASSIHRVTDAQASYLLYRAAQSAGMVDTVFFAGVVLVVALELTRIELLPRSMATTGAVVALLFFAGGLDYLSPDSGPLSGVRALGGVLTILYLIIMSVRLLQRSEEAMSITGSPASAGSPPQTTVM